MFDRQTDNPLWIDFGCWGAWGVKSFLPLLEQAMEGREEEEGAIDLRGHCGIRTAASRPTPRKGRGVGGREALPECWHPRCVRGRGRVGGLSLPQSYPGEGTAGKGAGRRWVAFEPRYDCLAALAFRFTEGLPDSATMSLYARLCGGVNGGIRIPQPRA